MTTLDEFKRNIFKNRAGWLIPDIKKCLRKPRPANFLAIKSICDAIEFMGSLYKGSLSTDRDNRSRFFVFIQNFFPTKYHQYQHTLWLVFRNGMTHGFYPGVEGGVSDSPNDHLEIGDNRLLVCPHVMFNDLKAAMLQYERLIEKKGSIEAKNFEARFNELAITAAGNDKFQLTTELTMTTLARSSSSALGSVSAQPIRSWSGYDPNS